MLVATSVLAFSSKFIMLPCFLRSLSRTVYVARAEARSVHDSAVPRAEGKLFTHRRSPQTNGDVPFESTKDNVEDVDECMLSESMKKLLQWARQETKMVVATATAPDLIYKTYLDDLAHNGIVGKEHRESFRFYSGLETKDMESYKSWRVILDVVFNPRFDYEICQERLSTGTAIDHSFILIRKKSRDGSVPVVLLALGSEIQPRAYLERTFPGTIAKLGRVALQLMEAGRAQQAVAFLSFLGPDFCWGIQHASGPAVRVGSRANILEHAGERSLLELGEYVHLAAKSADCREAKKSDVVLL